MDAQQAKFLADYFANLLETESKTTLRVLEAVPTERRDYKPDPKSRTAWELALHVASGDLWFIDSICDAAFNWDPEFEKRVTAGVSTTGEIVEMYKREYPKRIARLRSTPAAQLAKETDFFGMMKQPAVLFLGIANNHGIHHRGQLAAYLRAMGSKVPSMYGGSADEPMQG